MDKRQVLSAFSDAFLLGKSRVGPIPAVLINWIVIVGLAFFAYQQQSSLIAAIAGVVFLAILVLSGVLNRIRLGRCRSFYKNVRYSLGLQSFNDHKKDSSRFVKMRWNWLQAEQILFTFTPSKMSASTCKSVLNDLQATFSAHTSSKWIIDLSRLKQGEFVSSLVGADSYAHSEFTTYMTLSDVARTSLNDMGNFPSQVRLKNERMEEGKFVFDEVTITTSSPKTISSFDENKILNLFNNTFAKSTEESWIIEAEDATVYRFYKIDKITAKATANVLALLKSELNYSMSRPVVTFENSSIHGDKFIFDAMIAHNITAQNFGDYKIKHLQSSFTSNFPLPKGFQWKASYSAGVLTIAREAGEGYVSDIEENALVEEDHSFVPYDEEFSSTESTDETSFSTREPRLREPAFDMSQPVRKPLSKPSTRSADQLPERLKPVVEEVKVTRPVPTRPVMPTRPAMPTRPQRSQRPQ